MRDRPLVTARSGRFLVADAGALAMHPDAVAAGVPRLDLPGGEGCKTFAGLEQVLRALAQARIPRDGEIVVLGGGAVCDLGSLAASLYLRGVAHVLVPTTLLAMLDASVGGKTAINLPEGKNLVGTFWPAREVVIDVGFVATQDETGFRSGLGEALKIAVGLDAELFALLQQQHALVMAREQAVLQRVIELALRTKQAIVARDPRERGERKLLNLGHTLGHALEAHSGFTLPHGLAVARGILWVTERAQAQGVLPAGDAAAIRSLLAVYGFTAWPLPPAAELAPFLAVDKKGGDLVLPTAIGASRIVAGAQRLLADEEL